MYRYPIRAARSTPAAKLLSSQRMNSILMPGAIIYPTPSSTRRLAGSDRRCCRCGRPDSKPRIGARLYLIGSSVVFVLVLGYVGWTFFSRWKGNRAIERRAAEEKHAQSQQTFEGMGGNRFDILGFYANPGVTNRGDSVDLCYSVSNA